MLQLARAALKPLAAASDLEGVLLCCFGHADGDIAFGLTHQTFTDDPRLHLVAFTAGKR